MSTDDRMETITAETDNPTVCITHGRFIPCRNEDWHHFTDNPYWVKSVRDFQGSDDPNLTWEPATLTITDPAEIRATDEPDERTTPAPVSGAGLDLVLTAPDNLASLTKDDLRRLALSGDPADESAQTLIESLRLRLGATEAEVVTLRAKVAAVEALVNNGQTVGWIERDGTVASVTSTAIRAALATTGEGE